MPDIEKRQGMPKHYTAFIGFERPCHVPFRVLWFFFSEAVHVAATENSGL